MDRRERAIRRRLRDDFPHYADRCLRIRIKDVRGAGIVPLTLNAAQRYIHTRIEEQRQQIGRVRVLVLKGRQQGCSTYVEARYYWKTSHKKGARAFILTHEDAATQNLFEMAQRYHEHCPALVRPQTGASNAKELRFDLLDSGYRVATAGKKDVGRSGTNQFFHGSEVAFWPNAETHMAGAVQTVPDLPDTEIILESTSNGPQGMFYRMCEEALADDIREASGKPRNSPYRLIFVPWFWQTEYAKPVPQGWEATGEERAYAAAYAVTDEQLVWRRDKIQELGGLHIFRREYPATVEEAFRAEMPGAFWSRALLEQQRVADVDPIMFVRVAIGLDPATTSDEDSDETGLIVVAKHRNGKAYVLTDASGKFKPIAWARKAVALYDLHGADRIVAETNQGGEMVEQTLRTVRPTVSYRGVHASRSKEARAEPIAALYEQGLIHHVGHFPALEDQLCTWTPGNDSPDRLDALVWVLTDMMLGTQVVAAGPSGPVRESHWQGH